MVQHTSNLRYKTSRFSTGTVRRIKRRIHGRPIVASLLLMTLLLSTEPWVVWASAANAVKQPIESISSRIDTSEIIGGVSNWLKSLGRSKPSKPQPVQRVARRLHVKGNKLRISVGATNQITAMAVDDNEIPIDFVQFTWSSSNPEVASVDQTGLVTGLAVGNADIIATGANISDSFRVHVLPHAEDDVAPDPYYIIPSAGSGQVGSFEQSKRGKYSYQKVAYRSNGRRLARSFSPYVLGSDDPSPGLQTSPGLNVGMPPNAPLSSGGVDPSSSSYNRVFPIINLAGRGEASVSLSLVYNSQLWTYDSSNSTTPYQYNVNRDWPGPGFHLDFGKINWMSSSPDVYMYVGSDGTRHPMQNITTGVWETTDGTFIRIVLNSTGNYSAYFPNGVVIIYSQPGPDGYYYATKVQDRNGNFFTVTYSSTTTAQIAHITDTLGRNIDFDYSSQDSYGDPLLTSITAPDQNNGRRTVANFYYDSGATVLSGTFSNGAAKINGKDPGCTSSCGITYLHRIFYPATGTGYVLTKSGVYGQITSIEYRVGMTTASEGDASNNVGATTFNYPGSGPLTSTPKFDIRTEWWRGINTSGGVSVSYHYRSSNDGTYNIYSVTGPYPTGSTETGPINVQKTPMSGTFNGIIYINENQNSSGTPLSRTSYSWNTDSSSYSPLVSSVTYTDVPSGLSRHVNHLYPSSGATYGNPIETDEYGFSNELLRKTQYIYVTSSNYTSPSTNRPRLLNLPAFILVYQGYSSSVLAMTEFDYDTTSTDDTGNIKVSTTGHDSSGFPIAFNYRGNRTSVKSYPNYTNDTSSYTQYNASYDVLGNLLTADLSCCEKKTLTYDSTTAYAWPVEVDSGSSVSFIEKFTYEPATGNITSHAYWNTYNGTDIFRTINYTYNVGDLRLNSTTLPTNAHTDVAYDDANLKVTQTTYQASGTGSSDKKAQVEQDFDGLANVLTSKQWVGGTSYNQVDNAYDTRGRLISQSNPHDSAGSPSNYTLITYDDLNRTTQVELPQADSGDQAHPLIQYTYDGQFSKMTDQVGRQKISKIDALGRTAQIIEVATNASEYASYESIPTTTNWDSVYGYSTTYSYDALDDLTTIQQGSETRSFVYDGLRRLLYESQPEQTSNISYSGGSYSKKYEYDSLSAQHVNSNLRRVTDSRGDVKTLFYDGLNRLIACKYSGTTTASDFYYFWDGATSLTAAADSFDSNTSFTKTTSLPSGFTGNYSQGRVTAVVNDGSTKGEFFEYGADGQVLKHLERVYDGSSSTDFTTTAAFNNLLIPTSMTYPSGRQVDYSYDVVNRLTGITDHGTGETYVSGLAYTNAGQVDSFNIGNTTNQRKESYTYNNRLQLASQKVQIGSSTPLLYLNYNYDGSSGNQGAGTTAGNTGQLISMTDNEDSTKSVSYTYDLLGRLKTAQAGTSGWSVKEDYDRYGNRWLQDRAGNTTTPPSSGSATLTVSGSEQSEPSQYCDLYDEGGQCLHWTNQPPYDSGSVNVTVGGFTATAYYGQFSTASNVAADLAGQLGASNSPVTASVSGTTITLTAKTLGTSSNYTVSTSSYSDYPDNFGPSFYASGSNLTGGSNGSLGTGGTGPTSALTFDSHNHITSSGYSYDNGGNMTADGTYTYTYDGENRQTQVSSGSVTTTYGYNSDRARVIRTSGGVSTFYVYGGGGQTLSEKVGTTWHDYIYLGNRLLADVTSSGGTTTATTYHYPDRTSTRLTTDANGGSQSTQQTAPFGEVQSHSDNSATVPIRKFTTYDRDTETGNDYAINRQYASVNGRFTQPDPSGMASAGVLDPQSLNQYSYSLNDPVNMSDPLGLVTTPDRPFAQSGTTWYVYYGNATDGWLLLYSWYEPGDGFALDGGGTGVDSDAKAIDIKELERAINECLVDYFDVKLAVLDRTTKSNSGYAAIKLLPDQSIPGHPDRSFGVLNDVSKSGEKLKDLNNQTHPEHPTNVALAGLTLPEDPQRNYTASDRDKLSVDINKGLADVLGDPYLATQIHELGHSVADILGIHIGDVSGHGPDDGEIFANCVEGEYRAGTNQQK